MTDADALPGSERGVFLHIVWAAATWGTSFLFIKIATQAGVAPFSLATARGALTAVALAGWLMFTRRGFSMDRLSIRHMIVLGLVNGVVPNSLIAIAMRQLDSAPAAMIQASAPAIVALGGHFFLKDDRLTRRQLVGIVIGFVGVLVLVGPTAVFAGRGAPWGWVFMVCAAVSYAASTIYLRRTRPIDLYSIAIGQQGVSAVIALTLATAWERDQAWILSGPPWLALAGLAIVATAIPMIVYFRLVARVSASKAALVQYLLPVAAVVYAVTILGETLQPEAALGGLVVFLGVRIATRQGRP